MTLAAKTGAPPPRTRAACHRRAAARNPYSNTSRAATFGACFLGVIAASILGTADARAQDAFEIEVYDAETLSPGHLALQTHINNDLIGVRKQAGSGELPTHQVTHLTFEPQVGVCAFCEIGAYLQTAFRPDGHWDYAGAKGRFFVALPRRIHDTWGVGLNTELSAVPREYESTRFGVEFRPVLDAVWGRYYAALNPIVAIDFAGTIAGHPQLQPALKLGGHAGAHAAAQLEYYGNLGPVDSPSPLSQQIHRLFAVGVGMFSLGGLRWEIEGGLGYGLAAAEKLILKFALLIER